MEDLVFEHEGEQYVPFGKYIEHLGYNVSAWEYQSREGCLKNFNFVRIRYKGQKGGCKGALCFNLKDKPKLDLEILNFSRETRYETLFIKVPPEERTCEFCGKKFYIASTKYYKVKFCSDTCKSSAAKSELETECAVCGKKMHRKNYSRSKIKNPTCSRSCRAEFIRVAYRGDNNPNYKNKNVDSDGYRLASTHNVSFSDGIREGKLHKAICCEVFGLKQIKGGTTFHVHHRDCDILNNSKENLVLMFNDDHRWLHKQFGNATLWAYMNGRISLDDLMSWSDDQARAKRLLPISILDQKAEDFGIIKDGVLYAKDESQTN